MLAIMWSIAPVFVLIVLGNLLRRNGIPSIEFWNLNDKLVYWVLFPSLLFYKTSTITLAGELLGSYAVVILGGFAATVLFALAAGRALIPSRTSMTKGGVSLRSSSLRIKGEIAGLMPRWALAAMDPPTMTRSIEVEGKGCIALA